MQQPEDTEVVHGNYFNPEDMDNLNIHNCPPNTTPFGHKCVPLCKQDQQDFQKSEAETFEVCIIYILNFNVTY